MYKKLFLVIILFFSIIGLIREVNAETVNASLTIPYEPGFNDGDWYSFDGLGLKRISKDTWSSLINIKLQKNIYLVDGVKNLNKVDLHNDENLIELPVTNLFFDIIK